MSKINFFDLPNELILRIYEYDNSYKIEYDKVVKQILCEVNIIKSYWKKKYRIRIKTFRK